ncbi:MAG: NHLP bacteriocin export ABC transporter permease/ATPase subunit, partial [Nostoc sp.]
ISHISPPADRIRAIAPGRFSLIDGETLQPEPGAIAWVQMQQGNVRWMGLEKLTLDSTGGIFPLSEGMWLQAVQEVQLATDTTSAIPNPDTLLEGLSQLHTLILQYIHLLEEQEAEEELQRLRDRSRLNRQVTA